MLCIEIWCEDSTEHIQVNSQCDETIDVSCEVDELIMIWSNLCEQIKVSSEDISDHILIYSNWCPSIEIWSSFVCHVGDWRPYLDISPNKIIFPCSGNTIRKLLVQSNLNWIIDTKK